MREPSGLIEWSHGIARLGVALPLLRPRVRARVLRARSRPARRRRRAERGHELRRPRVRRRQLGRCRQGGAVRGARPHPGGREIPRARRAASDRGRDGAHRALPRPVRPVVLHAAAAGGGRPWVLCYGCDPELGRRSGNVVWPKATG